MELYQIFLLLTNLLVTSASAVSSEEGHICTFETGYCGYSQATKDNFDWVRNRGKTPTSFTGPTVDHSTNKTSGYYVYIEASSPRKPNDTAVLLSPTFAASSQPRCLIFWYYMYGVHVGSLEVEVRVPGKPATRLFNKTGGMDQEWLKAEADVDISDSFQLAFIGTRGRAHVGDFAIDDITLRMGGCIPLEINCTFQTGLCEFTQSKTDNIDWTRNRGNTSSGFTGPSVDHSTGNSSGYYMYMEASSPSKENDTAVLLTPVLAASTQPRCLKFWYHMYGVAIESLQVDMYYSGQPNTTLFHKSGNSGNWWLKAEVDIFSTDTFQLGFTATRGRNYIGDIAIDEITVQLGTCAPLEIVCTFQTDDCDFTQPTSYGINWIRGHGNTSSAFMGPSFDHSMETPDGYYIYTEKLSPHKTSSTAQLVSRKFAASNQSRCATFWYHMYGASIGSLEVKYAGSQPNTILFHKSGDLGDKWLMAAIDIKVTDTFQLEFIGSSAHIALDDFVLRTGDCVPMEMTCNFETTKCGFTQSKKDDFDWTRNKGKTPSKNTGPEVDHSKGTTAGFYMYIEASGPRVLNDKAILVSPTFASSKQPRCLIFWYHMYGVHIDTLEVKMTTASLSNLTLFNKTGGMDKRWLKAEVDISTTESFQLAFVGTRGRAYIGDIAIDDITVRMGTCRPLATCTFDSGSCRWTNEGSSDDFDWLIQNGPTPTRRTGPNNDHTSGNSTGKYIFIEASNGGSIEAKAVLYSEPLTTPTDQCFRFWYHMNGRDIGSLSVSLLLNGGVSVPVWYLKGEQGDKWSQAQVQLPAVTKSTKSYRVVFVGTKMATGNFGDISIDDTSLTAESCGTTPSTAAVTVGTIVPPTVPTAAPLISSTKASKGPAFKDPIG